MHDRGGGSLSALVCEKISWLACQDRGDRYKKCKCSLRGRDMINKSEKRARNSLRGQVKTC